MALYSLPAAPTESNLDGAYSILRRACEAASSFVSRFETVRHDRKAVGTATDHEQDLLRAALIFAAAGLDSCVKQLIRDTLRIVIATNAGARVQFTNYALSKLRRSDGKDLRFLAEAIAADRPSAYVQEQLVSELTGASLQSKSQILRVAAYFAIPADEISSNLDTLQRVFQVRNQIAHEMDILLGQPNTSRRQRKAEDMKKYVSFVLETASAFTSPSRSECKGSHTDGLLRRE